jgi:hypothetical protein
MPDFLRERRVQNVQAVQAVFGKKDIEVAVAFVARLRPKGMKVIY